METKKRKIKWGNISNDYPEVFIDWHPTLNGSKHPNHFKKNSRQKVWWKCHKTKCGHNWKDSIYGRLVLGRKCPKCEEREKKRRKPDRTGIKDTIKEMEKLLKANEKITQTIFYEEISNFKTKRLLTKFRTNFLKYSKLNKILRYKISTQKHFKDYYLYKQKKQ